MSTWYDNFHQDGFVADSSVSEQKYEIDLSSKEFCDIDESTNEPVGIYSVETKFEKWSELTIWINTSH